uniref:Calciumdependent protein kinase putative n=1 Tax=Albugo laibachii Nc14 TaxID=890382 RepID=F0W1U7_9STRA|nr:calciumdependent protein kinase putative [Albugo laibachii Nc14]CCA23169.1 calciumdependent protein kinase putative [Albugo laibachii Nc14]|eukprot:CCA23169.1 calciumdependent protein kinase putative [Albugo laibachii Nc14]
MTDVNSIDIQVARRRQYFRASRDILHKVCTGIRKETDCRDQDTTTSSLTSSSISESLELPTNVLHRNTDFVRHKITERGGGAALWVQAPVLFGEFQVQTFSWPKRWKRRHVELHGRHLCYFKALSDQKEWDEMKQKHSNRWGARNSVHSCDISKNPESPRRWTTCQLQDVDQLPVKQVEIKEDGKLRIIDDKTFSIRPNKDEKPWVLRFAEPKTRDQWLQALCDCLDILRWIRHYEIGKVLGVGGNGIVKIVTDRRNKKQYAMKIFDATKLEHRDAIVQEVEILRRITNQINHPNLVRIEKVYEENERIHILLQLCRGGELYDAIVERGHCNEHDAAGIMRQLMAALYALHQHNILHLDIKPENILLDEAFGKNDPKKPPKIILTDFGLARTMFGTCQHVPRNGIAGTVGYIAPEVITSRLYTPAADVFAAGVILYILLVGYPPFCGKTDTETMLKTARGEVLIRQEDWKDISIDAFELVTRMLTVKVHDRIKVEEVLRHPWMLQSHLSSKTSVTTIKRMHNYNFARKTKKVATYVSSHLLLDYGTESTKTDSASITFPMIQAMFEKLSTTGKLDGKHARRLVEGFGFSTFVDVHTVMSFFDQDQDGFITAKDYWLSIKAIHDNAPSFANIIFSAFLQVRFHAKQKSISSFVEAYATDRLYKCDFKLAFELLRCPEAYASQFMRFCDDNLVPANNSDLWVLEENDCRMKGRYLNRNSHPHAIDSIESGYAIDRDNFAALYGVFPFLRTLFLSSSRVCHF